MFLARTDEQRRFEAALGEIAAAPAEAGPSQVYLVYGLGGMGKTELCLRFDAIANGELSTTSGNAGEFFVATVNWQDERRNHGSTSPDPAGVPPSTVFSALYDTIANHSELEANKRLKKQTNRAFEPYRRVVAQLPELRLRDARLAEALAASESNAGQVSEMLKGTVQLGASVAMPGSKEVVDGLARAARAVRESHGDQVDQKLIGIALRPEESLTRELARGLRDLSKHRPVVVIFDTYEIIASSGGWIRQAMRETGKRVLWVVAARLEPEEEAGSRGDMASFRREIPEENLRMMGMSLFERETIREELTQRGVADVDETMLDAVVSVTSGVPMAVGLVAGMLAQGEDLETIGKAVTDEGDTTDLVRKLTERYLLHALDDPSLAKDVPLLLGLALLYADRGDSDILRAIWGDDRDIEATQAELAQRHDFVLTGSRRLHQEVRDTFRLYLLDRVRRDERRSANRRASEIALSRAKQCDANAPTEARILDEEWRSAIATLVWHRFWEGNEAGFDTLCEVFPAAVLLQRPFAHELVRVASFFGDTFSAEQESLLRGLASLLSFGSFLDNWIARRRKSLLGDEALRMPGPGDREMTDTDRRLALDALRASVSRNETLSATPPQAAVVNLLIAKSSARSDPDAAIAALESASEGIPPDKGELAMEVAKTARDLARRPASRTPSAPSDEELRASELWAAYGDEPIEVSLWLGWAHSARGEASQSLAAYDEAKERLDGSSDVESRRDLARALFNKALALERLERRKKAIEAYDQLIERFGEDEDRMLRRHLAKSLLRRATMLGQIGKTKQQIAGYEALIEQFVDDPQLELRQQAANALIGKASVLEAAGKPRQAVEVYDWMIEHFDDEDQGLRLGIANALFLKGVALWQLQEYRDELQCYDSLLEQFEEDDDPSFRVVKAKALFNKAYTLERLGEVDEEIKACDELIEQFGGEKDPELQRLTARALAQRIGALQRAGRPVALEETQEAFERLLAAEPTHPETYSVYALFLTDVKGDHELAQTIFERGVAADPEGANTLGNFARLLFEQGDREEALDLASRALAHANEQHDPLRLEVHFYIVALGPARCHDESLTEIHDLLARGVRSPGWNLERILDRAAAMDRSDLGWLRVLAAVINEKEELGKLDGWDAWPSA